MKILLLRHTVTNIFILDISKCATHFLSRLGSRGQNNELKQFPFWLLPVCRGKIGNHGARATCQARALACSV